MHAIVGMGAHLIRSAQGPHVCEVGGKNHCCLCWDLGLGSVSKRYETAGAAVFVFG